MKRIRNENLREEIYNQKLDNGINLFYFPKKGFTKKYAIFTTNYGSTDNIFTPLGESEPVELPEGIAHFLEHKLFEEPDEDLFQKFSSLGAYVNAYTNFNQTSYLFYSTDNFYENLKLLVNFVQSPFLTEENVEKEKGIIAQEIQMYQDNPKWVVFFNTLKAMYYSHPVRTDIAGTVESINKISKDDLETAYKTFYNPGNMVLFVVGDLDRDEIVKTVKSAGKDYADTLDEVKRVVQYEPDDVLLKSIEERMMTSKPLFQIGIKDTELGLTGRDSVKKDIITNIILDMLFTNSSEFYNELYSEGLVDSSFGAYFTGKTTYGHSLIAGQSDNPKEVYDRIVEMFSKPEDYITEEAFLRIKRKEIGTFLTSFNSIEFIANNLTDLYFQDFLLIDYLDVLNEITFEDILKRFKIHFRDDRSVISIIWPELETGNN
ncbi:EF-P 5-aminopentanol modification-associated protein YfmH [Gudongella sp. DL1XJH-153]|uniref:EF-P 5-aminopentanol modification-associated protein YfmH n=1 Tax=Gudongella sp. DL1XJH-153 TaxID=3409804 RepID=UPI003BB71D3D